MPDPSDTHHPHHPRLRMLHNHSLVSRIHASILQTHTHYPLFLVFEVKLGFCVTKLR